MAKVNKWLYEYVIQGNYGYGWDDLISEETKEAGRAQLCCYRDNERDASHRMIKRRVPNPAHKS